MGIFSKLRVNTIYRIRIYCKNTGAGACVTVCVLSVTYLYLVILPEYSEEFQCGGWKVEEGTLSN